MRVIYLLKKHITTNLGVNCKLFYCFYTKNSDKKIKEPIQTGSLVFVKTGRFFYFFPVCIHIRSFIRTEPDLVPGPVYSGSSVRSGPVLITVGLPILFRFEPNRTDEHPLCRCDDMWAEPMTISWACLIRQNRPK